MNFKEGDIIRHIQDRDTSIIYSISQDKYRIRFLTEGRANMTVGSCDWESYEGLCEFYELDEESVVTKILNKYGQ